MDQLRGSRKGLMFTLVTVLVVVLMLGEVLTYLYTNTQYSNLGVQANPSQSASSFYSQVSASSSSFLQTSLTKAVYALSAYETSNAVGQRVTSGSYALASLVDNGTIYGTSMNSIMGGYTLSGYAATLAQAGAIEGLTVSISNANAVVFQNSGGQLSASFSTLLNVTSQYGAVAYPITANASIPISGLPDLFGGSLGSSASYSSNRSVIANNSYGAWFNGATTWIATGTTGYPTLANSVSFFAWIYPTASGATRVIFDYGTRGVAGHEVDLYYQSSSYLSFYDGVYGYNPASMTVSLNAWHFVGFTYGGGTSLTLYLDGIANTVTLNQAQAVAMSSSAYIGTIVSGPGSQDWSGSIADVQIYNAVLPANSISALYREGLRGPPVLPANIVGWYLSGNQTAASSASLSSYQYVAAPIFVDNAVAANCGDAAIGGAINPSNYILFTANAFSINSIVCGFAGLVTYQANTLAPTVRPYLVYNVPVTMNTVNNFVTGQRYILDGNSLTLSDYSSVQAAVYGGSYVGSSFAPTYLNLIGGYQLPISPYGAAPLSVASRYVASFNSVGNITASSVPVNTVLGGTSSVSFWMQWPPSKVNLVPFSSNAYSIYIDSNAIGFSSAGNLLGARTYGENQFTTTPWVNIVAEFSNNVPTPSNDVLYVNGVRQSLQLLAGSFGSTAVLAGSTISIGGFTTGSYSKFYGQIADVQVYNTMLTPYQAESLYLEGINGGPYSYANLAGWWPLNGNSNDYSKYHNNGNVVAVSYGRLTNYAGDSLDGGSFYRPFVSTLEGVSGCYSRSSCGFNGPGKIYVPLQQQSYSSNSLQTAASSLGFANDTVPAAAYFNGSGSYLLVPDVASLQTGSGTIAAWINTVNAGSSYAGIIIKQFAYGIFLDNNNFILYDWNGGGDQSSGVSLNDGRWHFVAATFNSGVAGGSALYVDGVSKATGTITVTSQANPLEIGAGSSAGIQSFNGMIADVQVYNTPLTAAQVGQLYLNNSVRGISPAGWWPLNSGYNGYNNQTGAITGNVAVEYKGGAVCTEAGSLGIIGSTCGISYLPFLTK